MPAGASGPKRRNIRMHIRIHGVGRCIHLLSFFEFQRARAAHEAEASRTSRWDFWSARGFFRRHFHGAYEIVALRSALAHEIGDVSRLSDDDVVDASAQRLCSGAWCVGYDRPAPATTARAAQKGAAATGTGAAQRQAATPPLSSARRPRAPAPVPPPAGRDTAAAAAAPEDVFQNSDQAALAETLRQAAAEGAPFCEVCAKGKR